MNSYRYGITNNKSSKAIKEVAKGLNDGDKYEPSIIQEEGSPIYKINRMSKNERASLVNQLKQDQQRRQEQFYDIVRESIGQQAGSDEFWQKIANGEFEVDAVTAKKAKDDISENGYWGVKQTSERLFDFACALAGDDVDRMKEMQEALQKGFDEATKVWGRDLPEISNETLKATNQMFDDYFKSKGVE